MIKIKKINYFCGVWNDDPELPQENQIEHEGNNRCREKGHKMVVVEKTYAIVDPRTMMVSPNNTNPTEALK